MQGSQGVHASLSERVKAMSRKDEYQAYLRSPSWRSLSMAARFRAGNRCEFCGMTGDHVHHVKYPKQWAQDHIDNLIVVCSHHHDLLHGIRGDTMSGKLIVIEGIDVQDSFMDFRQLYASLYEASVGIYANNVELYNSAFDRGMMAAWNQIFHEYKKIEDVTRFDGKVQKRLWVNVSGALQLAGKYDSPKTVEFQKKLYGKILPAIANTGRYIEGECETSDDPVDQQLDLIVRSALQVKQLRADQRAMKLKQDALEESQAHLERRLDEEVKRLDEYTGGNIYETARLACIKHGIKPTQIYRDNQTVAMALGAWATREAKYRGLNSAPKLQEGTFLVNQYPPELLAEGIRVLGIQSTATH